jgi:hypothetical protein
MSERQPGEVEAGQAEVQPSPSTMAEAAEDDGRRCACTLFAVLNPDGSRARGFGAVSSQRFAVGQYEVVFNRDVTGCAYIATIGLSGSSGASPSGEITVVGRFGNANGVFLTTHDSAGNFADRGFHLAVHCQPSRDDD